MSAYCDVVFNTPAKGSFTYSTGTLSNVAIGQRVSAPFGRRSLTGFVVATYNVAPDVDFEIKDLTKLIDEYPLYTAAHIELAEWMSSMYFCSTGEALAGMLPGAKRESSIPAIEVADAEDFRPHELSREQERAVAAICGQDPGYFYLYGITGSGKTEVFLKCAERVIEDGKQALYLVPEISLTHQLTDEVSKRFGGRTAVLHSGLTPNQKLSEWKRIIDGDADLVIGPRSAVFAPLTDIGLIVVDEEHEGSYKSGSTPRYHARQVAMKRKAMSNARLVMGSATPSVEAFDAMERGVFKRLDLSERLSGGAMPHITVIDMKRETNPLSNALSKAIHETLSEQRQVILFLNRRGFSYHFHCSSCGHELQCKSCSVSLTYHKSRGRMICHYCGYSEQQPSACPECGSLDVGYFGFGTELIEEEVKRQFPQATVVRVDTDSVKKRGALAKALSDFRDGRIDILLGTQMVAKGLNFPGVKLVGIVRADSALHLPDFRAQERTFGLIVQVAGRAGRYSPDGMVYIQTHRPENDAIRLAANGEIEEFYRNELKTRTALGFPPSTRIMRIVTRSKKPEKSAQSADQIATLIRNGVNSAGLSEKTRVLGPAECPLSVISGNHRYQLIITTRDFGRSHDVLGRAMEEFVKTNGVYVEIDIDPVSLL